jgi:hypothetical protein
LTWAALVREGVSRLLPIASIGGEVVGIRLVILRGINGAVTTASVLIEVLVTLISQYLFTAIGVMLLIALQPASPIATQLLWALGLTFPIPILLLVLLRNTRLFQRLHIFVERMLSGAENWPPCSATVPISTPKSALWSPATGSCCWPLSGSFGACCSAASKSGPCSGCSTTR